MGKTMLLDCTMRDGGYTNNWNFGEENIYSMTQELVESGAEIVELGFLRDEETNCNRTVWNDIRMSSKYIPQGSVNTKFAVMCEVFNKFPIEKLAPRSSETPSIIRVIVWKRMIDEALEYCKSLIEKGYDVCIQPDRVNQYSQQELREMIEKFNTINPYALYIVDSNGLLSRRDLMPYFTTADKYLKPEIKLGYHGHNNLLQTVGAAESFVEMNMQRDIIVDASVMGIGRSSGNLNIEIFAKYLNDFYNTKYKLDCFIKVFDKSLKNLFDTAPWGYFMETYITALHQCNPNYGPYLKNHFGLGFEDVNTVVNSLSKTDKIIFNKDALPDYIKKYVKEKTCE